MRKNGLLRATYITAGLIASLVPATMHASNQSERTIAPAPIRPEVRSFINDMVAKHGFDRQQLIEVFSDVKKIDRVIELVKPAPAGKPRDWTSYRTRTLDPLRIQAGITFWSTHAEALARAEAQFGVPAEIIVGIIGVETGYGRHTGNFRTVDALTTLAFDYPEAPNREARAKFFKSELENTLLYASEARVDPLSIKGSFAGAVGLPQFMPSNIRRYGIDFDKDGHVDLRTSPVDAIGSVAHFLVEHGWKRGIPVGSEAHASEPDSAYQAAIAAQRLRAKYTQSELRGAGVTALNILPQDLSLGLVNLPNAGAPTQYYLGTANFFAITKYNRSFFYAMSVVELGREVSKQRN